MKKIVVLTGAGISAESGLATFRGSGGLWEGFDIMDVASIEGWYKNPALVLDFYNKRRKQALSASPNQGHKILAQLQDKFEVTIITQNVDDLHERAGSKKIIHLHGELSKSRSTVNPRLRYDVKDGNINIGDVCARGSQLRPDIVWFGEAVPLIEVAIEETKTADVFIVVGTSLQVYPAAGLIDFVKEGVPVYVIDPEVPNFALKPNIQMIQATGSIGLEKVFHTLMASIGD